MNLENFFLLCFLVGVLLSVVSFLFGNLHLHLHLPFHVHFDVGTAHAPVGTGAELSAINFGTITAFLAWFGGIGYLLSRHAHVYAVTAVLISIAAGVLGAWMIFTLIGRLIIDHDHPLDPMDYDMIGVLGRVSSTIRQDGTGEILFSQQGARRSSPARSDSGQSLQRDVEVVVTRFEKGIAYVRPWEELAGTDADASTTSSKQ